MNKLQTKIQNILERVLLDDDNMFLKDQSGLWLDKYGYINKGSGRTGHIKLHHQVIGKPDMGLVVDHINGNKLDNRRENLRFVTQSINSANKIKKRSDSKQEYKGIQLLPSGKYSAKVTNGKRIGTFNTALEAYNEFINYKEKKYNICLHY